MMGTLLNCYCSYHMPSDFSFSLHPLSWCSKQCCRLWFLGDGWKWKAILGPLLQHQHLGDWGTLSVSDYSTVNGHLMLYSISYISPAMTEWSNSYSFFCLFFFRLQPASRHLLTTGIFGQESGSRRKWCQCELNHKQRKHTLGQHWLCFSCLCKCLIALISFRVCYDRAPKHRLPLTFILSALWHGVYPGYYFTFITAIPITIAARAVSTISGNSNS